MCFKKKLTEPVIFAKKTKKKQRLGENAKKDILNTMHLRDIPIVDCVITN